MGDGQRCYKREYEQECGRVLGMKVWRQEHEAMTSLIACEGTRGLIQIAEVNDEHHPHVIQVLASTVTNPGGPIDRINFCNSVAITPDGTSIYLTDSSKRSRADVSHKL